MNQNKLSFESENLIVDWISFKFQNLEDLTKTKITNYRFQLGFNFYQESDKLTKPVKEPIFVNSKNKFQVCFIGENSEIPPSLENKLSILILIRNYYNLIIN